MRYRGIDNPVEHPGNTTSGIWAKKNGLGKVMFIERSGTGDWHQWVKFDGDRQDYLTT